MKYKFERKRNKLPIFVWYAMGVACSTLSLTALIQLVFALCSSYLPFWIAFSSSFWGTLLSTFVLMIVVNLTTFESAITCIEIDEEKQEVSVEYHLSRTFFLTKKDITIKMNNFDYYYVIYNRFPYKLLRNIMPLTANRAGIIFYDKTDMSKDVVLKDNSGWTTKQLDEIYHKLLEYKEPLETRLGPKFSKKYRSPVKYYR